MECYNKLLLLNLLLIYIRLDPFCCIITRCTGVLPEGVIGIKGVWYSGLCDDMSLQFDYTKEKNTD